MESLLMNLIGLLLGLIGIGLAELSYFFIERYEIPGFYWPDIEEGEGDDV
jgi:hypothetical protein